MTMYRYVHRERERRKGLQVFVIVCVCVCFDKLEVLVWLACNYEGVKFRVGI